MLNVGAKTAAMCWLALVAAGCSLLAFSCADDPNAGLRDSVIELGLLQEGPTRTFVGVCRDFEKTRAQNNYKDWVAKGLGSTKHLPMLSPDFMVNGLLWCPFPPKTTLVREALALVSNVQNSSLTLWPGTEFLNELGRAVRERLESNVEGIASSHQQFPKFYGLADAIAAGNRILSIAVTSDRSTGTHTLFQCANTEAVFDLGETKEVPSFPVQIIVVLEKGAVFCVREGDAPPSVKRIYGAGGDVVHGFYASYFGKLIDSSTEYSKNSATQSWIRDTPEERQVPNEKGIIQRSELVAFDFPAIQGQLRDLGSLSIDEAYKGLEYKLASSADTAEVFGVRLPLRAFLLTIAVSIPLLNLLFLAGLRLHGQSALPESLQGLPKPLLGVVVICGVCLLPASGLLLASKRLQFLIPGLAPKFAILAIFWLAGFSVLLALVHIGRRRASKSPH